MEEDSKEIIHKLHFLIETIEKLSVKIDDLKVERDQLIREFKELEIVGKKMGIV